MLEEINIQNLGVIENATLKFTKGLTVLTGETGAGKTMVLSALGLLLGKRSDANIIRNPAEFCMVEGSWDISNLTNLTAIEEVGAVIEDNMLYINRTVHKNGKSRAVVGGKTTPASALTLIGENLVNIHGQSDQIRLKSSTAQREALDTYAGEELKKALTKYLKIYNEWKKIAALIKDIKVNITSRQREYEELTITIADIEKFDPVKGEDEDLKNEISTLTNIDTLTQAMTEALNYLTNEDYENTDITTGLSSVTKTINNVEQYDPQLKEIKETAETLQITANELANSISQYLDNIDLNSLERLNIVQDRLASLNSLIRKYGTNLDDVIEHYAYALTRVEDLNPEGNNLETLEKDFIELQNKLEQEAAIITEIRQQKSCQLETAVNDELTGLAMAGSKLVIVVDKSVNYTNYGVDEISFLLKTPNHIEPQPLNRSASGGELSRIMLALEVTLANPETTPTFVFDEVDSGVGGATAIEIGKRLASLSKEAQVIIVTHLPQVAVFADNHLKVLKTSINSNVTTTVEQLTYEDTVEELARMLSGLQYSDTGKAHAEELIAMAQNYKNS